MENFTMGAIQAFLDEFEDFTEDMTDLDMEPLEDDLITYDHVHWYQYGRLALVTADETDFRAALRAHMDADAFWPNVWFISDHGNAHIIDIWED
jgi:hypothetical protein